MKKQEVQAVRKQLQQLNVELRDLKKELLTARVEELEQTIRRPAVSSYSGRRDMFVASLYQSKL
jgi:ribosomal protein L29